MMWFGMLICVVALNAGAHAKAVGRPRNIT